MCLVGEALVNIEIDTLELIDRCGSIAAACWAVLETGNSEFMS